MFVWRTLSHILSSLFASFFFPLNSDEFMLLLFYLSGFNELPLLTVDIFLYIPDKNLWFKLVPTHYLQEPETVNPYNHSYNSKPISTPDLPSTSIVWKLLVMIIMSAKLINREIGSWVSKFTIVPEQMNAALTLVHKGAFLSPEPPLHRGFLYVIFKFRLSLTVSIIVSISWCDISVQLSDDYKPTHSVT